jgi:hypothetical protein
MKIIRIIIYAVGLVFLITILTILLAKKPNENIKSGTNNFHSRDTIKDTATNAGVPSDARIIDDSNAIKGLDINIHHSTSVSIDIKPKQVSFEVNCLSLLPGQNSSSRLICWNGDYGFGESPPQSITVSKNSINNNKSYIEQAVNTNELNSRGFSWAKFWKIVFWIILVVSIASIPISITILKIVSEERGKNRIYPIILVSVIIFSLFMTGYLGYLAGSPFIFDNATGRAVSVYADGRFIAIIPAKHYYKTRVGGDNMVIEIKDDNGLIESTKIHISPTIKSQIIRAFFGKGEIVYNIGALNTYYDKTATYLRF